MTSGVRRSKAEFRRAAAGRKVERPETKSKKRKKGHDFRPALKVLKEHGLCKGYLAAAKRVHARLLRGGRGTSYAVSSISNMLRGKDPISPIVKKALHAEFGFAARHLPDDIWADAAAMSSVLTRQADAPLLGLLRKLAKATPKKIALRHAGLATMLGGALRGGPYLVPGNHRFEVVDGTLERPWIVVLEHMMSDGTWWSHQEAAHALVGRELLTRKTRLSREGKAALDLLINEVPGRFELFVLFSPRQFEHEFHACLHQEGGPINPAPLLDCLEKMDKGWVESLGVASFAYSVNQTPGTAQQMVA